MAQPITRRDFLKLSGLSLAWLAIPPIPNRYGVGGDVPIMRGRVTITFIHIYKEPNLQSERIGRLKRDTILDLLEVVTPEDAPKHNRRFYRIRQGFVYSAYIQRVDTAHLNPVLSEIPKVGQLGEVTVPYTQSFLNKRSTGWTRLYRLYFGSIYWITSLIQGPNGRDWYGLTDDLLHVEYFVPAWHIRPISPEEMAPISPDVPASDKRIKVSIREQTLTAFEGDQVVFKTTVSTGIPNPNLPEGEIPTNTPEGYWNIRVKLPSRHMGDGQLTSDREAYELPGVPWVSFFHETGVAIHGTYWHDNFGRMMSHGCVNMRNDEAKWIYRWSSPQATHEEWNKKGSGTQVHVYV